MLSITQELYKYAAGVGGAPAWTELGRKGKSLLGKGGIFESLLGRFAGARDGDAYRHQFAKRIGTSSTPVIGRGQVPFSKRDLEFVAKPGDALAKTTGVGADDMFRGRLMSSTLPEGPARERAMRIENFLYSPKVNKPYSYSAKKTELLYPSAGTFSPGVNRDLLSKSYRRLVMENMPADPTTAQLASRL